MQRRTGKDDAYRLAFAELQRASECLKPPTYDQAAPAVGDDVDGAGRARKGPSEFEGVDHGADRQGGVFEEDHAVIFLRAAHCVLEKSLAGRRRHELVEHIAGVRERAMDEQQRTAGEGPGYLNIAEGEVTIAALQLPQPRTQRNVDRCVQSLIDLAEGGDDLVGRQHRKLLCQHDSSLPRGRFAAGARPAPATSWIGFGRRNSIAPVQDPVFFDERNKFDRAVGAVGDPPSPPPQTSDGLAFRIELDMKPAEQVVGAIGGIDM